MKVQFCKEAKECKHLLEHGHGPDTRYYCDFDGPAKALFDVNPCPVAYELVPKKDVSELQKQIEAARKCISKC